MFVAMAEMRVLDEHIGGLQKGLKGRRRLDSTRGEEACRVSTAIDLGQGDLVSDSRDGAVMELLAGAKAESLLRRVAGSGTKKSKAVESDVAGRQIPWVEDAGEGLKLALGAALSFNTLKRTNVVVAYVRKGEIAKGVWQQVLELASKLELPVIFVVLPKTAGKKKNANLSAKARTHGVPGIAVDASDAVALYRVAQESMGRTRNGGGPVLIECMVDRSERGRGEKPVDPLIQMKGFLLERKVCTEAWAAKAGDGFRRRIEGVKL
jgi:TPP-dependent pyruvate/acetoin dehydrogenase alpha subunit